MCSLVDLPRSVGAVGSILSMWGQSEDYAYNPEEKLNDSEEQQ